MKILKPLLLGKEYEQRKSEYFSLYFPGNFDTKNKDLVVQTLARHGEFIQRIHVPPERNLRNLDSTVDFLRFLHECLKDSKYNGTIGIDVHTGHGVDLDSIKMAVQRLDGYLKKRTHPAMYVSVENVHKSGLATKNEIKDLAKFVKESGLGNIRITIDIVDLAKAEDGNDQTTVLIEEMCCENTSHIVNCIGFVLEPSVTRKNSSISTSLFSLFLMTFFMNRNKKEDLLINLALIACIFLTFQLAHADVISARIAAVHFRDDSRYSIGNNIPISIRVSALGQHLDTLYAVFIIKDSAGNLFDTKIEKLRVWHSNELTGVTLNWQIPITSQEGSYSITIELRNGKESDTGQIRLLEKFDSIDIPDAFEVKYDHRLSGKINSVVFDKTEYENGEELTASVRLLLGGDPHTYYLTAELVGSNDSLKIPHKSVSTTPSEMALHEVTIRLDWLIPEGLHDTYDVSVKLWSSYDDISGIGIGNLDSYYVSDAFKIEPPEIAISLVDDISIQEAVNTETKPSALVNFSEESTPLLYVSTVTAIIIFSVLIVSRIRHTKH